MVTNRERHDRNNFEQLAASEYFLLEVLYNSRLASRRQVVVHGRSAEMNDNRYRKSMRYLSITLRYTETLSEQGVHDVRTYFDFPESTRISWTFCCLAPSRQKPAVRVHNFQLRWTGQFVNVS